MTNAGMEEAPEELRPIISLLKEDDQPMNDPFYAQVQKAVMEANMNPAFRKMVMDSEMREWCIREEGIEAGRAEGIEEGERKERAAAVAKTAAMLKKYHFTDEQILQELTEMFPNSEEMIKEALAEVEMNS